MKIKEAFVRDLFIKYDKDEISFSRFVEHLYFNNDKWWLKASVETYHKHDRISGSLLIALREMMEEYASLKVKEAMKSNTPSGITTQDLKDIDSADEERMNEYSFETGV